MPIAVLGRYAGAYTHIRKVDWWDYDLCGGPIVEQVTPCPITNSHTPDRITYDAQVTCLALLCCSSFLRRNPSPNLKRACFHVGALRLCSQIFAYASIDLISHCAPMPRRRGFVSFPLQATHFVDLMRYLVGNIEKDSIQALAVGPHQMKLADMAPPPLAEHPVRHLPVTSMTPIRTAPSLNRQQKPPSYVIIQQHRNNQPNFNPSSDQGNTT